jgi:glycosyltransferase involved in cell wall biosynthesis
LLNNKYWSAAMKLAGHDSLTIMEGHFSNSQASDYDRYFPEFAPRTLPGGIRTLLGTAFAFLFVLRRARVLHMSYDGFALRRTWLWRLEALLLKLAGIKTIVIPYGADAYIYSRVIDPSLRHGLLASYPHLARDEKKITRRVDYWNRHADVVIASSMIDGNGRWDVTIGQVITIDIEQWSPRAAYSQHDGRSGPVTILHSPNHRGFKGTEFLISAVEALQAEGLLVELSLLEKVSNEEVRRRMDEADILAEQFIYTGYALSGIEGMACGVPVLSNLDSETYTRLFRRYAFLDECPILSTPPERLMGNLRTLVTNPQLRAELGRAGRAYVEKYHSYRAAQYLFGSIYRHFEGEAIELMTLFHPLKSPYTRSSARIEHPLIENCLPADWLS